LTEIQAGGVCPSIFRIPSTCTNRPRTSSALAKDEPLEQAALRYCLISSPKSQGSNASQWYPTFELLLGSPSVALDARRSVPDAFRELAERQL
jgi:hypothetical protein